LRVRAVLHQPSSMDQERNKLALFGSTGSIGVNTLDVVRRHPERYQVQYLTTNQRIEIISAQIDEFRPRSVVVLDEVKAKELSRTHGSITEILTGTDALEELASRDDYDTLIGALVGFAGLKPTAAAIANGKRICIANKETLVVAGELLTALAKRTGSEIIPIDSEHSAIAQCLVGEEHSAIRKIILTASGGPFRTRATETFAEITLAEALRHPNWVMGRKITIDSATLMNKGLEVIEAKWLFDVTFDMIEVIVHPQSIVHSMVEFVDGSVKAQLGAPDMRLPIQYALEAPHRLNEHYELLDLLKTKPLEFSAPDLDKFPCLRLAREAGEKGGLYPTILNSANEAAVALFLDESIGFNDIPRLIEEMLADAPAGSDLPFTVDSLEAIFKAIERLSQTDLIVREQVLTRRETVKAL
jgi:1-deoxy-D-xylulose-5-phosphate reductoisomerase